MIYVPTKVDRYAYYYEALNRFVNKTPTNGFFRIKEEGQLQLLNRDTLNWHTLYVSRGALAIGIGEGSPVLRGISLTADDANVYDVTVYRDETGSTSVQVIAGSTYTNYGAIIYLDDGEGTRGVSLKILGSIPVFSVSDYVSNSLTFNPLCLFDNLGYGHKILLQPDGEAVFQIGNLI